MKWYTDDMVGAAITGRTVLVTGANSGIGEAVTVALARAGARVLMLCRNLERGRDAAARIRLQNPSAELHVVQADLSSAAQIRAAISEIEHRFERLDVLVNNAGATFPIKQADADGHEATFGTNYLGTFLLTNLLVKRLVAGAPARIVNLVGVYYRKGRIDLDDLEFTRKPYAYMAAANQAQLARMIFTVELARRLKGTGVTVNAVHPGAILTNRQNPLPWYLRFLIHTVLRPGFSGPTNGARPVVRLIEDPELAQVSGMFFNRYACEEPAAVAQDEALAARLWLRSAELTGLDVSANPLE